MAAAIFSFILFGLVTGVFSQNVVTRTRTITTLEVLGGETIVTTLIEEGGVRTVTVVYPGYVLIYFLAESDRTCVIVFRAMTEIPEQTETIQGTTVEFPGTTISTILSERTVVFSTVSTEPGWTTTRIGAGPEYVMTVKVDEYEMTFEMPAYGELRERCGERVVSIIQTLILQTAPATFYAAFPGFTFTIPDMTYTIPGMTLDIEPFTTTYTTVMKGETEHYTSTFKGTTEVGTITLPATTKVSTIVRAGSTVTKQIQVIETITLKEETTSPATTTPTKTTETQTTPATETVAGEAQLPQINLALIAVVAAVVLLVVVAVALALRRRR